MNKPNKQTLVIPERIPGLLSPLPIARIKGFGGDFGERMVVGNLIPHASITIKRGSVACESVGRADLCSSWGLDV
jgi:nucleotidyltransferase/DNA polymerase involved in DNA repair